MKLSKMYFDGKNPGPTNRNCWKMHGAGSRPVMNEELRRDLFKQEQIFLLVPTVGTVPGFADEELVAIVKVGSTRMIHLPLSAIGTSQKRSVRVIEQIAIRNKVAAWTSTYWRCRIRLGCNCRKYLRNVGCDSGASSYSSSCGTLSNSIIKKEEHTSFEELVCWFCRCN